MLTPGTDHAEGAPSVRISRLYRYITMSRYLRSTSPTTSCLDDPCSNRFVIVECQQPNCFIHWTPDGIKILVVLFCRIHLAYGARIASCHIPKDDFQHTLSRPLRHSDGFRYLSRYRRSEIIIPVEGSKGGQLKG
jgi:hypothetical protein